MPNRRSSRRVEPLEEFEIDHEINLIDHSASNHGSRASSPTPEDVDTGADQPPLTSSESQGLLRDGAAPISRAEEEQGQGQNGRASNEAPTVQVQPCTPAAEDGPQPDSARGQQSQNGNRVSRVPSSRQVKKHPRPKSPEKAIDILYENERGGFLCGIPLFSGAALGNLDPSPWTNAAHKTSPTDIKTAQVPDPSWEWSWPSWKVNRDETIDTDKDGWEYSFMFSKKFSWHGPRWYNSFVRRRAWIRQRIRKGLGYQSNDPHLLNTDYFTVGPASVRTHSRQASVAESASNRTSLVVPEDDALEQQVEIHDIDTLMEMLRKMRIDREKLDSVQNYLEHNADDLFGLQDHMHEIMSIFVFQASRRMLLTRLIESHDGHEYQNKRSSASSPSDQSKPESEPPTIRLKSLQGSDDEPVKSRHPSIPKEPETEEERRKLEAKTKNLAAAIKHADEEVRRLEYWSDVKSMAEGGESGGAVADDKGWNEGWDGIDRSGGLGANKEELP